MKSNICYYCGDVATTMEHVPPKQMFRGFQCDSITVPSCEEHNCSKGGQDQAIVSALLMAFRNKLRIDTTNKDYFNKDMIKALNEADKSFERTKNRVVSRQLINLEPEKLGLLPELGFIKSPISIHKWINNLTAGIVFSATKFFDETIKWDNVKNWSPDFMKGKLDEKKSIDEVGNKLLFHSNIKSWLNSMNWESGWSAHPHKYPESIYSFSLNIDNGEVAFRHRFYKNYTWFVWFKPSVLTIEKLKEKISC